MYSSGAPMRERADTTGLVSCGLRMLALKKKNGTDSSSTTMMVSRRRLKEPTARPSADRDFLQQLDVVERLATPEHHGADRIVAHHDGQTRLFTEQHVYVLEQGATAGEHHALVH